VEASAWSDPRPANTDEGMIMGDKSPKAKNKAKKQSDGKKDAKNAAAAAKQSKGQAQK
jgi:hypothetical protein